MVNTLPRREGVEAGDPGVHKAGAEEWPNPSDSGQGMPLTKSQQMARVRSRGTRPERMLRSALWRSGMRYRLHVRTPGGRPDIVFPKAHVAIFVDGCFWHGCPDHYSLPRTRRDYWLHKLRANTARDRRQTLALEDEGWTVLRIWQHEIDQSLPDVVARIHRALRHRPFERPTDWRVVGVTWQATGADKGSEVWRIEALRDARIFKLIIQNKSDATHRM